MTEGHRRDETQRQPFASHTRDDLAGGQENVQTSHRIPIPGLRRLPRRNFPYLFLPTTPVNTQDRFAFYLSSEMNQILLTI